jgi:hypothetical protein
MESSKPDRLYYYLVSDTESKYLYAEVYYEDFSICYIDTERGKFSIHFSADPHLNREHESITADLPDFIKTLESAKAELLKFHNGINDPL